MVMTDPIFWGRELQICMDVLRPSSPGCKIPLYSAAADLEYSTELATPRLGAGAFIVALQAIYRQCTGVDLEVCRFGKPHPVSFTYAEEVLGDLSMGDGTRQQQPQRFYMVGDNPLTDIKGANLAGPLWKSVLTRTGMFQGDVERLLPRPPSPFITKLIFN